MPFHKTTTDEDLLAARLRGLTNFEAEQALLGGLMANNAALDRADQIVDPKHFADPLHGRLYEAIRARVRRGEVAHALTLRHQFDNDPDLAGGGGWKYLVKLENCVTSIIALPDYAKVIRDLWRRRELLKTADSAVAIAVNTEGSAELAWARLRDDSAAVWQADFTDQSMAEIMIKPRPTLQFLVPGMIPMEEVTLFSADGGTGKSYLLQQLLMAVASGTEWLGCPVLQGTAYGLFCEDPEKILHYRQLEICRRLDLEAANFSQMRVADRAAEDTELFGSNIDRHPLDIDWTPLWHRFTARMMRLRPAIIGIDTAADVFGGDENKRAHVRRFIRGLKHLAMKTGAAVVVAAHPSVEGMRSGRGVSGSTGWVNTVRSHLYLTRSEEEKDLTVDDGLRVLTALKANYAPKATKLQLRWDDGAYVRVDEGGGVVADIERRQLHKLMTDMVSDGEARGSLYSASPRAETRYIVKMLLIAHPKHSRKAVTQALDELLAHNVLMETEREGKARGGLIINPNKKPGRA